LEGKGIYVILLGIIGVLTLTVAVLVIFIFVTFNKPALTAEATADSPIATDSGPVLIPADELKTFNPFATKDNASAPAVYDLQASEGHASSFVQVTLLLKYNVGVKRENELTHTTLVQESSVAEIKQACSIYFKGLTYEDCKSPEAIPKAQDFLKEEFNRIVDENAADNIQIIYKVIIENMLPQ